MSAVKFCKDCKHFRMASNMEFWASHKCTKRRHKEWQELVTGEFIPGKYVNCIQLRQEGGSCGPSAKLFEAKNETV